MYLPNRPPPAVTLDKKNIQNANPQSPLPTAACIIIFDIAIPAPRWFAAGYMRNSQHERNACNGDRGKTGQNKPKQKKCMMTAIRGYQKNDKTNAACETRIRPTKSQNVHDNIPVHVESFLVAW